MANTKKKKTIVENTIEEKAEENIQKEEKIIVLNTIEKKEENKIDNSWFDRNWIM